MLGKCKLRRRMVFGRCFVNFLKNFPRQYILLCPAGLFPRAERREPRRRPWLGQRGRPRVAYCSARRVIGTGQTAGSAAQSLARAEGMAAGCLLLCPAGQETQICPGFPFPLRPEAFVWSLFTENFPRLYVSLRLVVVSAGQKAQTAQSLSPFL